MPGLQRLRSKLFLARWSLLLWALFTLGISLAAWQLFPGVHFMSDGGLQGILLVVLVDLVLGPLLFLIAANPDKPRREQLTDAIVLISIQLAAMGWGGWQVYTQRPVAISYLASEGMAIPTIAANFTRQDITVTELQGSPLGALPGFHVLLGPGDAAKALQKMVDTGIPLSAQREYLRPLFAHGDAVFTRQQRFLDYWAGEGQPLWQAWTAAHSGKEPAAYRHLLFAGRHGNAVLLVNADDTLAGYIRLPGMGLPAALK